MKEKEFCPYCWSRHAIDDCPEIDRAAKELADAIDKDIIDQVVKEAQK